MTSKPFSRSFRDLVIVVFAAAMVMVVGNGLLLLIKLLNQNGSTEGNSVLILPFSTSVAAFVLAFFAGNRRGVAQQTSKAKRERAVEK